MNSRTGDELHLPDGRSVKYLYDPLGRRIAKKVDGELREKYLWRDAMTLLAVMNPDDTTKYRFVYADDRVPYACQTATTTLSLAYDQVGSQ